MKKKVWNQKFESLHFGYASSLLQLHYFAQLLLCFLPILCFFSKAEERRNRCSVRSSPSAKERRLLSLLRSASLKRKEPMRKCTTETKEAFTPGAHQRKKPLHPRS
uniref:Transmembrane protein n=1 Tax=Pediastrum duplex TaxID=3105 RepID=A0A2U8GI62_PEDDU|nr:hypothetical protein [Pediastrum duplex]